MVELATQVKRRRGTENENDAFFGAEGEITVDLTNKELRLHTGNNKLGGYRIGRTTDRTNCITEIPQDIILELNNGTLTLKAGSKVYVPNGVGVFDEVVIQSDVSVNLGTGDTQFIVYDKTNNALYSWGVGVCSSGGSQPSGQYFCWYDTTNNLVKNTSNYGTTINYSSLPIATTNSTATAINQVFNGFGYIGSTVFVLPNVRGLIPNGRNKDGSLNNIEVTVGSVSTNSGGGTDQQNIYYGLQSDGKLGLNGRYSYDSINNYIYDGTTVVNSLFVDRYNKSGGQIVHFDVPTAFHALDYNDSEYIGHQSMPSDTLINLTLGASDSTYTAPADGYFFWNGGFNANATGSFRMTKNPSVCSSTQLYAPTRTACRCFLPVKKGDVVTISYNELYTTYEFKFLYAEGSK